MNSQASRSPAVDVGLFGRDNVSVILNALRVPLRSVHATCIIDGYCCETTLRQTFRHDGDAPVAVEYRFPVPVDASVSAFEARIGAATIAGRAGDVDASREATATATATAAAAVTGGGGGAGGGLDWCLTLDSGTITLAPGEDATFTISLVHELRPAGDGAVRFVLPPAALLPDETLKDAPVEVTVDLSFAAPAPLSIGSVRSPTHASNLAVSRSEAGERACARVEIGPVTLKRWGTGASLVVEAPVCMDGHGPAALVWSDSAHGDGGAEGDSRGCGPAFALSAAPSWARTPPDELEVVFAVDRAIGKARLAQAKSAVRAAIRSLPSGTRFDVVAFGSHTDRLFPVGKAQALTEKNFSHVDKFVDQIRPEMCLLGGDLWKGVAACLDGVAAPGHPRQRQVIVVTGGKKAGSGDVINLIKSRADDLPPPSPSPPSAPLSPPRFDPSSSQARVFPIGTCERLAAAIARAGGGYPEFIPDGGRLEGPVLRQLRRCAAPALLHLSLDWGAPTAVQAPRELPAALFAGDRLTAFAFGSPEASHALPAKATLGGRRAGTRDRDPPLAFNAPVGPLSSSPFFLPPLTHVQGAQASPHDAARLADLARRHGLAWHGVPYTAVISGPGAEGAAGVLLSVPCAVRLAKRLNVRRGSLLRASLDAVRKSIGGPPRQSLGGGPAAAPSARRMSIPGRSSVNRTSMGSDPGQRPFSPSSSRSPTQSESNSFWSCLCCRGLGALIARPMPRSRANTEPTDRVSTSRPRTMTETTDGAATGTDDDEPPVDVAGIELQGLAKPSTSTEEEAALARRPLETILLLMGAGGLWDASADLDAALGKPPPAPPAEPESALPALAIAGPAAAAAAAGEEEDATEEVLEHLEQRYPELQDEWLLAAEKARAAIIEADAAAASAPGAHKKPARKKKKAALSSSVAGPEWTVAGLIESGGLDLEADKLKRPPIGI
eukprot:tig00000411_g582.t1